MGGAVQVFPKLLVSLGNSQSQVVCGCPYPQGLLRQERYILPTTPVVGARTGPGGQGFTHSSALSVLMRGGGGAVPCGSTWRAALRSRGPRKLVSLLIRKPRVGADPATSSLSYFLTLSELIPPFIQTDNDN